MKKSELRKIIREEIQLAIEAKDRGREIIHTLKTKAESTYEGKSSKKYNVNIIPTRYSTKDKYNGMVLSIEGTPAHWYLDTLFGDTNWKTQKNISIQGQEWWCTNYNVIMKETHAWLKKQGLV